MNSVSEEVPIKYFAMIPHVIYELGLDAYEIAVYCLLKRISCENSSCTYSNENLAKLVNISVSKLKQIKRKLSETFSLIELPLIICNERKSEDGSSQTTEIKIVNIWPKNIKHFDAKKAEKKQADSENKEQFQNNYTGHGKSTPRGHEKTGKKNPGLKNIKEIDKEKKTRKPKKAPSNTASILLDLEKKEFVGITQEHLEQWKQLFPKLDIAHEIKKCSIWHILKNKNPKNCYMAISKWLLRDKSHLQNQTPIRDHGPNYEVNLKTLNELKAQFPSEMRYIEVKTYNATIVDKSTGFDLSLQMSPQDFEDYLIRKYLS